MTETVKLFEQIAAEQTKLLHDLFVNEKYTSRIKDSTIECVANDKSVHLELHTPEYYKYVDEGRGASQKYPPLSVMLDYVKSKNIQFKDCTVESTAYLIARSVRNKGFEGKHFTDKLIDNFNTFVPTIQKSVKNDFNNNIKQIL